MITYGQLLLAVSIPTVVALIGILLNNSRFSEVRADMAEIRTMFNHFIDYHIRHEGRISTLEERSKPKGQ